MSSLPYHQLCTTWECKGKQFTLFTDFKTGIVRQATEEELKFATVWDNSYGVRERKVTPVQHLTIPAPDDPRVQILDGILKRSVHHGLPELRRILCSIFVENQSKSARMSHASFSRNKSLMAWLTQLCRVLYPLETVEQSSIAYTPSPHRTYTLPVRLISVWDTPGQDGMLGSVLPPDKIWERLLSRKSPECARQARPTMLHEVYRLYVSEYWGFGIRTLDLPTEPIASAIRDRLKGALDSIPSADMNLKDHVAAMVWVAHETSTQLNIEQAWRTTIHDFFLSGKPALAAPLVRIVLSYIDIVDEASLRSSCSSPSECMDESNVE